MPKRSQIFFLGLILLLIALSTAACARLDAASLSLTPTPDYPLLETRTEVKLAATLTAKAPLPTMTPTPTLRPPTSTPLPGPTPTATGTPLPEGPAPLLVHVQRMTNESTNIIVPSISNGNGEVLTHFTEPWSIYALTWSKEGDLLAFVGSHVFLQSRQYERNIFLMRPDGSDLRMITGDYVAPADAPGPYVSLQGKIEEARGICRVSAQGIGSPVETDDQGAFMLQGVPQSAEWTRAVCQDGGISYQGEIALSLSENPDPITLTIEAKGQGWRDISLAPGGQLLIGTHYEWHLDEEDQPRYQTQGVIYDTELGQVGILEMPEEAVFHGASWSSDGERIIGGLADEEKTYLWEWDRQGNSIGALLEMDHAEDEILTIVRPVWSMQDSHIAFELHRWHWWGDPKFRTDLAIVDKDGENLTTMVTADWGEHATHASWSATGAVVFYQLTAQEADIGPGLPAYSDIWSVPLEERTPGPWTDDGSSYLPAVRPNLVNP